MSATLRAALVGCGRIGSTFADDPLIDDIYTHAGGYDACPRTTLVAVCDADANRAAGCARRWKVERSFVNVAEMLDESRPELVSVCTPDSTHATILDWVLERDSVRGILAEKPLALSLAEAERIVRRARDRKVVLAVNYTRRYSAGHDTIRAAIASGQLGTVQTVTGRYTKGLLHNGTHWIDLARWLIGEVASVSANHAGDSTPGDADLDVYLRFDNGARGALLASRADCFSIFEMDIVGTMGRVVLYDSGHRVQHWEARDSARYSGYRSLAGIADTELDMRDTLLHAVNDLVECVESGRVPRCDGAAAVATLRIATLAMQSAAEHRELSVALQV